MTNTMTTTKAKILREYFTAVLRTNSSDRECVRVACTVSMMTNRLMIMMGLSGLRNIEDHCKKSKRQISSSWATS